MINAIMLVITLMGASNSYMLPQNHNNDDAIKNQITIDPDGETGDFPTKPPVPPIFPPNP